MVDGEQLLASRPGAPWLPGSPADVVCSSVAPAPLARLLVTPRPDGQPAPAGCSGGPGWKS